MEIAVSSIAMESQHSLAIERSKTETLVAWTGEQADRPAVQVNLSPEAQEFLRSAAGADVFESAGEFIAPQSLSPSVEQAEEVESFTKLSPRQQLELKIVETLLERITGKKVTLLPTVRLDGEKLQKEQQRIEKELNATIKPGPDQKRHGWGLAYHYEESYSEEEELSFAARGVVKTTDGREVAIEAELHMSRSFYESQSLSVRAGDAVFMDPLVISFSGQGAELGNTTLRFDLDADGKEDQISELAEGSGFLALDRNENGKVDDGSELFGPKTGSGFGELRGHDDDGDGWIDEGDEVFHRLRIWENSGGEQRLITLGERGVGAIYLGSSEGEFTLTHDSADALGRIKETGLFVSEDGSPGFVQDVDVRVR